MVECEARLRTAAQAPPPTVASLPTLVARHLSDLRATLNTDVEAARALLARLVGSVILRRRGSQLLAEIEGKIDSLMVDELGGDIRGAGRGISSLPNIGGVLGLA